MNTSFLRKTILTVGLAAGLGLSLAQPVLAEEWDHDHHGREHEWREREWREHHRYYEPPPVVYAAPAPTYYVPPPVVMAPPMGLNIVVPLRIS